MHLDTLHRIAWVSFYGFAVGLAMTIAGGYLLGAERATALLTGAEFPDLNQNATYLSLGGAVFTVVCLVAGCVATAHGQHKENERRRALI